MVAKVVIIGGCLAGLTCASRAAALGLETLVLEAGSDPLYACNSRISGGLFHIAMDDMTGPRHDVLERIATVTGGQSRTELAQALVDNARPALEWLKGQGVSFMKAGPDGQRKYSLAPPRERRTGLHWRGRGGDTMLRTLAGAVERHGGQILLGHEVVRLLARDGRCIGVVARHQDGESEIAADAVVICDGGFQADPELVARHVSPAPEKLLARNAGTGRGTGLRLAQAMGAATVGLEAFYGHVHHRDAMQSTRLWPFPVLDSLCTAGILVDGEGRRFCDEGLGGVACANAIARLADPLSAHVVFDDAIWEDAGRKWLMPANPYLHSAGGTIISAPSIAALAERIGVGATALAATIAAHNDALSGKMPVSPPRSLSSGTAAPGKPARPFWSGTIGATSRNAGGQDHDRQRQAGDRSLGRHPRQPAQA